MKDVQSYNDFKSLYKYPDYIISRYRNHEIPELMDYDIAYSKTSGYLLPVAAFKIVHEDKPHEVITISFPDISFDVKLYTATVEPDFTVTNLNEYGSKVSMLELLPKPGFNRVCAICHNIDEMHVILKWLSNAVNTGKLTYTVSDSCFGSVLDIESNDLYKEAVKLMQSRWNSVEFVLNDSSVYTPTFRAHKATSLRGDERWFYMGYVNWDT